MTNNAFVVNKTQEGKFVSGIEQISVPKIGENEVLIKATYSSLNFKDALSSIGNPGVSRSFPHVTGIDVAGIIQESNAADFVKGDEVLVTGYDMGMNSDGGHQSFVKVPSGKNASDSPESASLIRFRASLALSEVTNRSTNFDPTRRNKK